MEEDQIRLAAFNWLKDQVALNGDVLPRTLLESGFECNDQRTDYTKNPSVKGYYRHIKNNALSVGLNISSCLTQLI